MSITMSAACWQLRCGDCSGEIEPGMVCDCPVCHVSVYPVGLLQSLQRAARSARRGHLRLALQLLGRWRSYVLRQARRGNWRAVSNSFNGYLAEHATLGTRCGTGWTKRRALADLRRHLAEEVRP